MKESIKKKIPQHMISNHYMMEQLLSDFASQNVITKYFSQIIRPGDYYTLKDAKEIIEEQNFSPQKENNLLYILEMVNRKGIALTRKELGIEAFARFYRVLKTLAELNINPVTIPKSFGVKKIPNLLLLQRSKKKLDRMKKMW